jgi:hypothetical protein
MPKKATHAPVVRQWLISLAVVSAVNMTRDEAEMRFGAYLPLLVDRFPDAAFTTASLEYVAAQSRKGFPTYGELAAYLADWWRANRPQPPALPAPPPIRQRDEPTPEERAHVARVTAETIAHLRSIAQPEEDWRRANRRPRYLSPDELDRVNPLPGGRRRVPEPTASHDWTSSTDERPARDPETPEFANDDATLDPGA